jgi:hypothetical protein
MAGPREQEDEYCYVMLDLNPLSYGCRPAMQSLDHSRDGSSGSTRNDLEISPRSYSVLSLPQVGGHIA